MEEKKEKDKINKKRAPNFIRPLLFLVVGTLFMMFGEAIFILNDFGGIISCVILKFPIVFFVLGIALFSIGIRDLKWSFNKLLALFDLAVTAIKEDKKKIDLIIQKLEKELTDKKGGVE